MVINKPIDEVFDYVKMLENQSKFSVWMQMDPNMEKTYSGTDGQIDAIVTWNSSNSEIGRGEQKITGIEENKRIDYEFRFYEPF